MSFVGALPKETLEQMAAVFPVDAYKSLYICCSGSFRVEQAYTQLGAKARLIGNDVSLLSCALGALATSERKKTIPFTFIERLAYLEDALAGKSVEYRVAGLLLASDLGIYAKENVFEKAHWQHYQTEVLPYLEKAVLKVRKVLDAFRLDEFHQRDFREHAKEGIAAGGAIIAAPPSTKGDYEKRYAFMGANVRWEPPLYAVWDPKELVGWVQGLVDSGAPYCVETDQLLEGLEPAAMFTKSGRKKLYLYARTERSAYRHLISKVTPFNYDPVGGDEDLKATSKVEVCRADTAQMNFLKERYLAKGIIHVPGDVNFLVFIDGKLAGGFIYARSKFLAMSEIYLLSDFSVTKNARVSKLIALITTSYVPVGIFERRVVMRAQTLCTTAFTQKAVSMKYRGAYKVSGRGESSVQYTSHVRQQTPQELYNEWYARLTDPAPPQNTGRHRQAPRPKNPG